jgi:hypothetical protein
MPGLPSAKGSQPRRRSQYVRDVLALGLIGTLAVAGFAGQKTAPFTVKAVLTVPPVSVVTGPGSVVVCGTASLTGATGCDVIPVPPTTPPSGGAIIPTPPGGGGTIPTLPVVPVVPVAPVVPAVPVVPVLPPVDLPAVPNTDPPAPPSVINPLPLRVTPELLTVLQIQPTPGAQGGTSGVMVLSGALARMEQFRAKSLWVFGTGLAGTTTSTVLGTSAEMRLVRDPAFDYTEMILGW